MFRAYPLDGAMVWFHRDTGTYVRLDDESTRDCVRVAPRVVMFGITNACNLHCSFCSRDVSRASRWDRTSVVQVLSDLSDAGVLEVAFGGGEPFTFRGFDDLLFELHARTALALNVTTNGTRFDAALLTRIAPVVGQVRLSLYDHPDWRPAAAQLSLAGVRWGANVIVDRPALTNLPSLFEELRMMGARDVSLLSYVGPEDQRHLSAEDDVHLARVIGESPLPCRVSVCFGKRLAALHTFTPFDDAEDCGAGHDFVTLTSDKRVQSCSFHDEHIDASDASAVLDVWRNARLRLRSPATRRGCSRIASRASRPRPRSREVRVWQGFSGNNSGECLLVARFDEVADAEKLLADLAPGFVAGEAFSPAWRELFTRERVASDGIEHSVAPDEMTTLGRTFIARTEWAVDDDFPEIRALAWRRGGFVANGGIHVHDGISFLFAVRAASVAEAKRLAKTSPVDGTVLCTHGVTVVGLLPLESLAKSGPVLALGKDMLAKLAGKRPLAAELVWHVTREDLERAVRNLGADLADTPRLAAGFYSFQREVAEGKAKRLAGVFEGQVTHASNVVLVDHITRQKRSAVAALRASGTLFSLSSERVHVTGHLCAPDSPRRKGAKAPPAPKLEVGRVRRALDDALRRALADERYALSCTSTWSAQMVGFDVETAAPAIVLRTVVDVARSMKVQPVFAFAETNALDRAVRRVLGDLTARARNL